MLRAVLVLFAMLAACATMSAAQVVSTASAETTTRSESPTSVSNKLPTPNSNSAAGESSAEDSAAENELLRLANKSRELAGVSPLSMDESLREAARAHAQRMIASGRLEHQFSGEPELLERIAQVSSLRMDRAGENLANATCTPDANEMLMRSPPHRENLLDPGFNIAGIVAIWSKGRLYVVQDFAREMPSYSEQQSKQLVDHAVDDIRQQAGLPDLVEVAPLNLDDAACSLARESRPDAHLLATAYDHRAIIAYTQSRPEVLPRGAVRLLRDPSVRQFAVGSCYARNTAYPTGMYWVAILLY